MAYKNMESNLAAICDPVYKELTEDRDGGGRRVLGLKMLGCRSCSSWHEVNTHPPPACPGTEFPVWGPEGS